MGESFYICFECLNKLGVVPADAIGIEYDYGKCCCCGIAGACLEIDDKIEKSIISSLTNMPLEEIPLWINSGPFLWVVKDRLNDVNTTIDG